MADIDMRASVPGAKPNTEARRILIVAPDCPYPPHHGGRAAFLDNIDRFRSLGYTVDLLFTAKTAPTGGDLVYLRQLCDSVIYVARVNHITDMLHPDGLQIRSRKELANVALPHRYDLVCLEGPYVAAALDNPALAAAKCLLRWHNDEPEYFRNLSRSARSLLKKLYYRIEAQQLARVQAKLVRTCDAILTISNKEMETIRRYPAARPTLYVPMSAQIRLREQRDAAERVVLFVGSLFMPNNIASIRWYLDMVHPKLIDDPRYMFHVAGRIHEGSNAQFDWIRSAPRTRLSLSPSDLSAIYAEATLFVNPAQDEAGVKVKNYEAAGMGLAIVSTSRGIAGSNFRPGVDIVTADDAEAFATAVRTLLDSTNRRAQLVANSRATLRAGNADGALAEMLRQVETGSFETTSG